MDETGTVLITVGSHTASVGAGALVWHFFTHGFSWRKKNKSDTHEIVPKSEWEETKNKAKEVDELRAEVGELKLQVQKFSTRDEQSASAIRIIIQNINDGKFVEAKAQAILLQEFISHRY